MVSFIIFLYGHILVEFVESDEITIGWILAIFLVQRIGARVVSSARYFDGWLLSWKALINAEKALWEAAGCANRRWYLGIWCPNIIRPFGMSRSWSVGLPHILPHPIHSSHGELFCSQLECFCLFFEISLRMHDENRFRIAASAIELWHELSKSPDSELKLVTGLLTCESGQTHGQVDLWETSLSFSYSPNLLPYW